MGRRKPVEAGLAAAFVVSMAAGLAGVTWNWLEARSNLRESDFQKARAESNLRSANAERDRADRARDASDRLLAGALLDRGIAVARRGDVGEGLLWMHQALTKAPAADAGLSNIIRTNLAAWRDQSPRLRWLQAADGVRSIALSPDGRRFLAGANGWLGLFDAATGRAIGPRLDVDGDAHTAAIAPDGRIVAVLHKEVGYRRRDYALVQLELRAAPDHPGEARWTSKSLAEMTSSSFRFWAWNPDVTRLAVGDDDRLELRDTVTGRPTGPSIALPTRWDYGMAAFSPDGRSLAACVGIRAVRSSAWLVDLAGNRATARRLEESEEPYGAAAFSPDGARLLIAGERDGRIRRFDRSSSRPLGPPAVHPGGIRAALYAPDGRQFLTVGHDGTTRWWDAATGEALIGASSAVGGSVAYGVHNVGAAAILPGARQWLMSSPGRWRLWERPAARSRPSPRIPEFVAGRSIGILELEKAGITGLKNGLRGRARPGRCGPVRADGYALVNPDTGLPRGRPLHHPWATVYPWAIGPSGTMVATACADHVSGRSSSVAAWSRLWDAATGRPAGPPLPQDNWVAMMDFSPDGKVLATAGYDGRVQLWETATGARIGARSRCARSSCPWPSAPTAGSSPPPPSGRPRTSS